VVRFHQLKRPLHSTITIPNLMLSSAPIPAAATPAIPSFPSSSFMEGFGLGSAKDEDDFDMQFDETEALPPPLPPPSKTPDSILADPSPATLARIADEDGGSSSGEEEVLEEGTF
jgi:hypothetical protein